MAVKPFSAVPEYSALKPNGPAAQSIRWLKPHSMPPGTAVFSRPAVPRVFSCICESSALKRPSTQYGGG